MKTMADRYDASGEPPRLVHRDGHRTCAGQLAKGMPGVEDDRALSFRYDGSRFVAGHGAFQQPADIHVDQHYTVRRQPFEIGFN